MKRSAPMKRTAFKAKPANQAAKKVRFASVKKPARKATLKSKGPRMTPIRRAARGRDCTLRIPGVCNWNPETTVLCHSNLLADGKGMGIKAPDEKACFGCSACHDVLDGRAPRPDWLTVVLLAAAFESALQKTHVILRLEGLIKE